MLMLVLDGLTRGQCWVGGTARLILNHFATTFAILIQLTNNFALPATMFSQPPKILGDPIINVQALTPTKIKPIAQASVQPIQPLEPVQTPSAPISPSNAPNGACGDNSYANFIYTHESGCSLTVRNAEGCIGIGQACPASKLLSVCPNLDYACENSFFTSYANAAYGGWAGAYAFWTSHHWWWLNARCSVRGLVDSTNAE